VQDEPDGDLAAPDVQVVLELMPETVAQREAYIPTAAQKKNQVEFFHPTKTLAEEEAWQLRWKKSNDANYFYFMAWRAQIANRMYFKDGGANKAKKHNKYGKKWPPAWKFPHCIAKNYSASVGEAAQWSSIAPD